MCKNSFMMFIDSTDYLKRSEYYSCVFKWLHSALSFLSLNDLMFDETSNNWSYGNHDDTGVSKMMNHTMFIGRSGN